MTTAMTGHREAGLPGIGGVTQAPVRDGIHKPALKLELEIGPGLALLLSSPVAVGVAILVGWVLLTSLGIPVYGREMFAAGIVSAVGGTLAVLPLFAVFKRGAAAIAKAAIMGIGLRCGLILAGVILAMGPGWSLDRMPLVYWVLGCYFPVLIVETAMVSWLCQKANA